MPYTSSQTKTHTILLVDDDQNELNAWASSLRDCSSDYAVLKANTVKAALDLCSCQKIDCVVLDLDMNDVSGFEVLFALVPDRKNRGMAVVILTHLLSPSLHEMAVEYGAHACLLKQDTSPQLLGQAIHAAIASTQADGSLS